MILSHSISIIKKYHTILSIDTKKLYGGDAIGHLCIRIKNLF